MHNFEIHCINVEKVQSSSSVQGKISTTCSISGGEGSSTTEGETKTIHTSQITSSGKMYTFKETNSCYPFSEGDEMVFLCKKNNSGMYDTSSVLNNSNGTRVINYSPNNPQVRLAIIWLVSSILLFFSISLFSLLICFCAIFYTIKKHPSSMEEFEKNKNMLNVFLSLEGAKNKAELEKSLSDYKGLFIINAGVNYC